MKIRQLKKKEIKSAAKIVGLNYSKLAEKLAIKELGAMFHDLSFHPNYVVAEVKGKIIGLAGYIQDWIDYNIYGIFWVNVAPAYQRRGIGQALIKKIIGKIAKKPDARLIILTTQKPKFYTRFGFKTLIKFTSKSKISKGRKNSLMALKLK